jgi:hypothetical protein
MIKISPKKYMVIFFTMLFVMVLFTTVLASKSLFFDSIFGFQNLYRYQLDKLVDCNEIETIFVGDSSLGNAIDAELFSELSTSRSLNMALTVRYGYAGTYNMIKKTIKTCDIKNIVVVHTLDILSRPTSYDGYLYSIGLIDDFNELDRDEKGELISAFYNITFSGNNLLKIMKHYMGRNKKNIIVKDFMEQGKRIDINETDETLMAPINSDKTRFLYKIRRLSKENNINLIYVHGPVLEPVGKTSTQYIEKVNTIIEDTGVKLIPDVTLIKTDHIGDTEFHVFPDNKEEYTLKYYALIKDHLIY